MTERIFEFYKDMNNSLLKQLSSKQDIINTYSQLNKINEEHIVKLQERIEELEKKLKEKA